MFIEAKKKKSLMVRKFKIVRKEKSPQITMLFLRQNIGPT